MRIAIVTLPLHTNYGGILQAYALQTVLERMGHQVDVLNKDRKRHISLFQLPIKVTKRFIKKYILRRKAFLFEEHYYNRTYPIISQHTQLFIDKYIHSRIVNDLTLLKEGEYDALVVGSDQIWRPSYYPNIQNAYFSFARDWKQVKRIAYAPSFGTNSWKYTSQQTNDCKELIKKFDLVTVREKDAVALCEKYLETKAIHVLDPTMLLNTNDYEAIIKGSDNVYPHQSILLTYVLDSSAHTTNIIQQLAKTKGLTPFYVSSKVEDFYAPLNERIQKPVEQWLNGFKHTDFVITDSFHACVFSIIFNKPFVVLGNKDRGMSRFTSLLSLFGLENRLVADMSQIEKLGDIDWKAVNKKREILKEQCLHLLQVHLK